jgi:GxxExxY protein
MAENADTLNQLTEKIIHGAIKVHRALGPGLLESAYRECLAYELQRARCRVDVERALSLEDEGLRVNGAYRVDLLVEGRVVVEVKSIERFEAVHTAQMLTCLRLTRCRVGLILNFNRETLVSGVKRVVNDVPQEETENVAPSA